MWRTMGQVAGVGGEGQRELASSAAVAMADGRVVGVHLSLYVSAKDA